MVEYEESRLIEVFSKRFPIVGLIMGGASWIIYSAAPRNGRSINDFGPEYWNAIDVAIMTLLIGFIIFTLSFIMYILYRPLSQNRKGLNIALRIVITPVVLVVILFATFALDQAQVIDRRKDE